MPELTLCQVRTAANAYLSTRDLPRASRRKRLEKVATIITQPQPRHAKARRSHRKRTCRRLRLIGINLRTIRRCRLE